MPITIYPGTVKKRNSNGTYSDLIPGADINSQIAADIATQYDSESTYEVGDYCLYEGDLYVCNTQISTPEEWSYLHWTETTVGDEISEQKADTFGSINLTGTNTTGATISADTFFYNNDVLVRATTSILNGATVNIGTNAEIVSNGGLNALNDFTTATNVTSWMVTDERDYAVAYTNNNFITLTFRTVGRTNAYHVENEVIMNVPEPYRPVANLTFPAFNGSTGANAVQFKTNGDVVLWVTQASTSAQRVLSTVTYPYK